MTENPYEYHLPIASADLSAPTLIERERPLRQALDGLKRGHFLVVSAPPRSGTTTFLRRLARQATAAFKGMRCIYVDLANVAQEPQAGPAVLEILQRELERDPPEAVDSISDLCRVLLEEPGPPRVLLLDGFEKVSLAQAKDLVMDLRAAFTESQVREVLPPIRFVLGSAIDLRALTSVGMTSPLNIAREVTLDDFDAEALGRLSRAGLPGDGWAEFVAEVSGGHPCVAQMACHGAFEALRSGAGRQEACERARKATQEEAEAAFGPILEALGERRDHLTLLAEVMRGREVPFDRNDRRIRALAEMGILKAGLKATCAVRNEVFEAALEKRFKLLEMDPSASRRGFPKLPPTPPEGAATIGVGKHLGDFRIVGEIGHGSMGTVFEAVQESLGRRVALKVLPANLAQRPQSVERFYQEARAAANLRHPNIVTIYAVGESGGVHYYAMELVDGHTLEALFAKRSTDYRRIAALGEQAALALAHGHENGVIHRDIKPSNVMVNEEERVKVTDYGLARIEVEATGVTSAVLVGTPMYMSPEQASSPRVKLDARTDIYSLGATLYYAVTSGAPFDAEGVLDLIQKVVHVEPRPLRSLVPDIPLALEAAIVRAMKKDREERYPSALHLAEELHLIAHGLAR